MDFKDITAVVADDFSAVDAYITHHLDTNVPLIREIGEHIISGGGKRLRPLVGLLCARAYGYQGTQHIDIAAIIEFLHTATLLHDDVVDESDMRRGRPTANAVWGNAASVLVGDFLISRAFELLVKIRNFYVLDILSASTNVISEGEVLQMLNSRNPSTTEEQYMRVIHHKTAKMFESAAETGAVLMAQNDDEVAHIRDTLGAYGRHLGIAFQLVDDVLDYTGDAELLGKNVGDDLAEGKPTLPLIYAMREGSSTQAELIRQAILNSDISKLEEVVAIVQEVGGLEYTQKAAEYQTQLAIDAIRHINDSPYKEALVHLARQASQRNH